MNPSILKSFRFELEDILSKQANALTVAGRAASRLIAREGAQVASKATPVLKRGITQAIPNVRSVEDVAKLRAARAATGGQVTRTSAPLQRTAVTQQIPTRSATPANPMGNVDPTRAKGSPTVNKAMPQQPAPAPAVPTAAPPGTGGSKASFGRPSNRRLVAGGMLGAGLLGYNLPHAQQAQQQT